MFPLRPGSILSHRFFIGRVRIPPSAVFQVSPSLSGFSFSLQMDSIPLYIKKNISSLHPSLLSFISTQFKFLFKRVCVCVCARVWACVCACLHLWVGGGMGVCTCVQLLTAWLECCDPNLQQPWALVTAVPSLQLLHPDSWRGSLYSLFLPLHYDFKIRPAESWLCPFQWLLLSKVSGSVVC